MSNHTPGPWGVSSTGTDVLARLTRAGGQVIAVIRPHAEAKANARLMAAAPELLDALNAADGLLAFLRSCIESGETLSTDDQRTYAAVRSGIVAAIAKAEGRHVTPALADQA